MINAELVIKILQMYDPRITTDQRSLKFYRDQGPLRWVKKGYYIEDTLAATIEFAKAKVRKDKYHPKTEEVMNVLRQYFSINQREKVSGRHLNGIRKAGSLISRGKREYDVKSMPLAVKYLMEKNKTGNPKILEYIKTKK